MKHTVQQLVSCILSAQDIRAKHEGTRVRTGIPTEYLVDLLDLIYSEFREAFLRPYSDDPNPGKYMGTYPEQLLLRNLFVLFLDHLDENVTRELFAEFGPKPPRLLSTQRQRFLLDLYIGADLPPKMQFVREVVNYNKTVPQEERLGSRSTSEVSMLKYVERMLKDHSERVKCHMEACGRNPPRARKSIREVRAEMPITKTGRQFPRKMSRQT